MKMVLILDRLDIIGKLERFRNYDQFKDYFTDLQNTIMDVIHYMANVNWGKAGKYF